MTESGSGAYKPEIAETLTMPPGLKRLVRARILRHDSNNSTAVYQRYVGCYDGNLRLSSPPLVEEPKKYSSIWADRWVIARCTRDFKAGRLSWVAQVMGPGRSSPSPPTKSAQSRGGPFEQLG